MDVLAATLNSLGITCGELGERREKIEFLNRSLKIIRKKFGNEHPDVAGTLLNLGNAYGKVGNNKEKLKLLNEALQIFEKIGCGYLKGSNHSPNPAEA